MEGVNTACAILFAIFEERIADGQSSSVSTDFPFIDQVIEVFFKGRITAGASRSVVWYRLTKFQ